MKYHRVYTLLNFFTVLTLLLTSLIQPAASLRADSPTQASPDQPSPEQSLPDASEMTQKAFLPFAAKGGAAQPIQVDANAPPINDESPISINSSDPDSNLEAEAPIQAATCYIQIKFSNQTASSLTVYWVNSYGQEVLYKSLPAWNYYWQQSYYGHKWRVRNNQGTLLKEFAVNTCSNLYITMTDSNPTPTAQPQTASLGDRVWEDSNRNGIQDSGEPGLANITINLWVDSNNDGSHDTLVGTTRSDANGKYSFSNLDPSKRYVVKFSLPTCYAFTQPNVGDDTLDSDVVVFSYGGTSLTTVVAGQLNATVDAGMYNSCAPTATNTPLPPTPTNTAPPPTPTHTPTDLPTHTPTRLPQLGAIGDRVWKDLNGNGQQDADEPSITGAIVNLWLDVDGDGKPDRLLSTTMTDGNGTYLFSNLEINQKYIVQFTALVGYSFTTPNLGNDASDSDAKAGDGYTDVIILTAGQKVDTVDAGLIPPKPTNTPTATHTAVPPTPTSTATPTHTATPKPVLASLGDFVWMDANKNGQQESDEPGVAGVEVNLWVDEDRDGSPDRMIETVKTNSSGKYLFTALDPNLTYLVEFVAPSNTSFTLVNVGNDSSDSDAQPNSGLTDAVTLIAGQNNPSVDAGLVEIAPTPTHTPVPATPTHTPTRVPQLGSIGDRIFDDLNQNGIQDAGEPGINGITVQLRTCLSPTSLLASTTTAGGGFYRFTNLAEGCYRVRLMAPTGYTISPQNQGDDEIRDSDMTQSSGNTGMINLGAGENRIDVDGGLFKQVAPTPTATNTPAVQLAALGDKVWSDLNANGLQESGEPGLANVKVSLWVDENNDGDPDQQIASTTTNSEGIYSFSNLDPNRKYLVQFIALATYSFTARDAGNDEQDSDANPSNGYTGVITLTPGQSNTTIDAGLVAPKPTATPTNTPVPGTGVLGDRVFNDLNQNGIQDSNEPGIDSVTVQLRDCASPTNRLASTTTANGGLYKFAGLAPSCYRIRVVLPTGYVFSPQNEGSEDTLDSDMGVVSGLSPNINLMSGQSNLTVDAGLYKSDVVPTPTPTPSGNNASIGNFAFIDLNSNGIQETGESGLGNVTVQLWNCSTSILTTQQSSAEGFYRFENLAAGCYVIKFVPPAGYAFSPQNQGSNDNLDSDADVTTGATSQINLAAGQADNSQDAGVRYNKTPGNISGRVWFDRDNDGVQETGEPDYVGLTIRLLRGCTGHEVAMTVVSNSTGGYNFTQLPPGQYRIEADSVPGLPFSPMDVGDDALDSDISPTSGQSACVTLNPGQTLDLDVGVDPIY